MVERIRNFFSARTVSIVLGALSCAAVVGYGVWFSSAGQFVVFPTIPNGYIDLGQAFLHGQLALLEEPDSRLASLPNPYDLKQRKDIPYLWDASYYNGKYYLYWGPVPGLVAGLLQGSMGAAAAGPLLVILPYLGLLAIFVAILVEVSKYFSGRAPPLSIWLFVLLGFVNFPFLYVLGNPRTYEIAILYGQLFLMAGLICWVKYIAAGAMGIKSAWLAGAGLNWGLAVGCRYNLVLSVVVYVGLALIWFVIDGGRHGLWRRAALLVLPLFMCAAAMGIYNFARFSNPFETGLTYQLTIPQLRDIQFSLSYVPLNLYIYLLYPLTGTNVFPFMLPPNFHPHAIPDWLSFPKTRLFDQDIPGMIPSVPAVWLLALAIPSSILALQSVIRRRTLWLTFQSKNFLFAMIFLGAGVQFLFLIVFFYLAERYIVDFYPSLILIMAMLVWQVDERLRSVRLLRPALWMAVAFLTLWTIGISYFGSFGVRTLTLTYFEPALVARIALFWNHLYAALQGLLSAVRL